MSRLRRLALALSLLVGWSCRDRARPSHEGIERLPLPVMAERAPEQPTCADRIAASWRQPELAGVPPLDARRLRVLAAAKGEPVVFTRAPVHLLGSRSRALPWARKLDETRFPWDIVHRLRPAFAIDPAFGRAVVLREGYVHAETPELAFALVDQLSVQHLFREPRIWVQRGETTSFARRASTGRYVWEGGADAGRPVALLLHDRLGVGEPPPALTLDFRALRDRLHFDRARIQRITKERIIAKLRYGDQWAETLLRRQGAELGLECEVSEHSRRLERWRDRAGRQLRVIQALRRVMLEQIDEGISFDEPMTEVGQQDGRLRPAWQRAYLAGRSTYRFNVDRYPVFDLRGRPIPPQICLDFLTDTLERASGTWWRPAGQPRERTHGRFDLEDQGGMLLRSVDRFLTFARRQTGWFQLKELPERERVPIGKLDALIDYLTANADDFRPGDMVFILGWTPWDPHEPHYHSFFVYESDPFTGFPMLIAGNAGRPSLRVWRNESLRTPKRAIVARLRPRLEWLESIVTTAEAPSDLAAPLR
jgi:hypothetical protein